MKRYPITRTYDFIIPVDIFEIKKDGSIKLENTIAYDANHIRNPEKDTEDQTKTISEDWVPNKRLLVNWYFSDGLTISYTTKDGIIYNKEIDYIDNY